MEPYIDVAAPVKNALKEGKPVVALESTIITHGMPFPANKNMALEVETIIRERGAIPASIALVNGRIKVGLTTAMIDELAQTSNAVKISKRDLSYVIQQSLTGGTTVSATMLIAEAVGIDVFATGGIGGVHRGHKDTLDISRDLEELATCSVAVVCAGAKSILDIEKTLEYLETKAVEVIGYQTDVMPEFYTASGDFSVSHRLDSVKEIATVFHVKRRLGFNGGMVIANPIPQEASMDKTTIDRVIEQEIKQANAHHIKGKALTPYLLSALEKATKGQSLTANIALVKHNAALAADLAISMAKLS